MVTAERAAEYGRKNKSPESLLAAASILYSLKAGMVTPLAEKPMDENGKPLEDKALESKTFEEQAEDLFDEARKYAKETNTPGVDAMIKAIKARKSRDLVGGPQMIKQTIRPGQSHVYKFKFIVGKPMTIGFAASHPMRFVATREDVNVAWSMASLANHLRLLGGKGGSTIVITIRVFQQGQGCGAISNLRQVAAEHCPQSRPTRRRQRRKAYRRCRVRGRTSRPTRPDLLHCTGRL